MSWVCRTDITLYKFWLFVACLTNQQSLCPKIAKKIWRTAQPSRIWPCDWICLQEHSACPWRTALLESIPLSISRSCGPLGAPPYTQQCRILHGVPNVSAHVAACCANSRVGTKTRHYKKYIPTMPYVYICPKCSVKSVIQIWNVTYNFTNDNTWFVFNYFFNFIFIDFLKLVLQWMFFFRLGS